MALGMVVKKSIIISAKKDHKQVLSQNDDQAAKQLQKERSKLFKTINERDLKSGWVIRI